MGKELINKLPNLSILTLLLLAGITASTRIELPELNYSRVTDPFFYEVSMEPVQPASNAPFLGKSFNGFKEALAYNESRGNYQVVNPYGYMGKYQFGSATLRSMGVLDSNEFLSDPALQEKVFIANLERNKWVLRKEILRFSGKRINGVLVTESGLLAAAHLAGPSNVKKFLYSGGSRGFKDANGTSIRYYMRKFGGYDVSMLQERKKVRVM